MSKVTRFVQEIKHLSAQEKYTKNLKVIQLSRFDSYFYRSFGMQFAYGHREILLRVMQQSLTTAFPLVLQHGVYTPGVAIQKGVALTPRKNLWSRFRFVCFSKSDQENVRKYGIRDVVAIGAPWLYLSDTETKTKKNSLGFFPAHGNTAEATPCSSLKDISKRIQLVRKQFPGMRLTVFLYYSEFIRREWHELSRDLGFEVFCAGLPLGHPVFTPHLSRIDFLFNLKQKLNLMEACVYESYTSAILYAGSLGKSAALIRTPMTLIRFQEDPLEQSFLEGVFRLGKTKNFVDEKILKDFSLECLGQDALKRPEQLNSILEPIKLKSLEEIY